MPKDIDFFFDFISPYTYLADTQLSALQERTGARVRYRPMHLLRLMKMVGNVPTTVICANKMKYASQDLGRWVSRYGVPFQMNPHLFSGDQSLSLKGALVAEKQGPDAAAAYNQAIFRAFWIDAVDTNDRGRLAACIDAAGLRGDELLEAAEQGEYEGQLAKNTELAAGRGVFGSPTFLVGEEMFFGNDRLEFLEQYVRG